MNQKFLIFLSVIGTIILAGCSSVDYQGETLPETRYTKLFFSRILVPPESFRQIGTGSYTASEGDSSMDVKKLFIEKGNEVGADAVLFVSFKEVEEPGNEKKDSSVEPSPAKKNLAKSDMGKFKNDSISAGDPVEFPNVPSVGNIPQKFNSDTAVTALFFKYIPQSVDAVMKKDKGDVDVKQLIDTQAEDNSFFYKLLN